MGSWVINRPAGSFVGQEDTNGVTIAVGLPSVPADFDTATSVSIALDTGAVSTSGQDNDFYGLECRIMSGATVLAAADAGGGWVTVQALSDVWTVPKDFPAINFAYVNTAESAVTWNAAVIQYRQLYTKKGKADNGFIEAAEDVNGLTVVYAGLPRQADAAFTLEQLLLTSAGLVNIVADSSMTLGEAISTIRGSLTVAGSSTPIFGAVTMAAAGTVAVPGPATGDLTKVLDDLTIASASSSTRDATGAFTLGDILVAARATAADTLIDRLYDIDLAGGALGGSLGDNLNLNDYGITTTRLCGEPSGVSAGDLCYVDSAGKMSLANATTEAKADTMLTIATENLAHNASGEFLIRGYYVYGGFPAGDVLYAGTTDGAITNTAPSASGNAVRIIGYADSGTRIFFDPDKTWMVLT